MAAEGNENRVIIDTSPVKRQLGYGQRPGPSFRCVAVQICHDSRHRPSSVSRPMMRHRGPFRPLQGSEALLYAAACEPSVSPIPR